MVLPRCQNSEERTSALGAERPDIQFMTYALIRYWLDVLFSRVKNIDWKHVENR